MMDPNLPALVTEGVSEAPLLWLKGASPNEVIKGTFQDKLDNEYADPIRQNIQDIRAAVKALSFQ